MILHWFLLNPWTNTPGSLKRIIINIHLQAIHCFKIIFDAWQLIPKNDFVPPVSFSESLSLSLSSFLEKKINFFDHNFFFCFQQISGIFRKKSCRNTQATIFSEIFWKTVLSLFAKIPSCKETFNFQKV